MSRAPDPGRDGGGDAHHDRRKGGDGSRDWRWTRGDIRAPGIESLSWAPEECEASIDATFRHVQQDALEAIRWYAKARRPKRRLAVSARLLAVLLLGGAGILPLIDVAIPGVTIPGIWVTLLAAGAAGVLAFDRFHGGSTGWIRYIQSELKIRDALETFELDWEAERATWGGGPPTADQVQSMLRRAKRFAMAINRIVQEETAAWVDEFQRSISQIDEALRTRAAQAEQRRTGVDGGAVNLVVTNGDQCDAGWEVSVDEGVVRLHADGQSAAIRDLPPGIRLFDVAGMIAGKKRRAQFAANIPAGSTVDQRLTLS